MTTRTMKQVLFIEPDAIVAALYGDILTRHEYDVIYTKSAQQAIAAADKHLPDVVVTELQIARHNGVEFLYEFKSYTEWQNIPVVVLSSLPARTLAKYTNLTDQLRVVAVLRKSETTAALLLKTVNDIVQTEQR